MPAKSRLRAMPRLVASSEEHQQVSHAPVGMEDQLSTLQGRLRYLRALSGKTQAEVAMEVGCARTAVAQWETARDHDPARPPIEPSLGALERLAKALNSTPEWLTFRRGNPEVTIARRTLPVSDTVYIDEISFGSSPEDVRRITQWGVPEAFIVNTIQSAKDDLRVFTIASNAVSPVYEAGDKIFVDLADRNPAQPGYFLYWNVSGPAIGRLQMIPSKSQPMVTIVTNDTDKITLPADDVEIIGRAKGRVGV